MRLLPHTSNLMSDHRATPAVLFGALRKRRVLLVSIAAVLAIYAGAGFWLVPWLVKRELPGAIESALHRRAEIGAVAFNPFVLGLRLEKFRLRDTDGSTLAAFDEFYVNAQLSSVFRRAATFAEVRLEGPYLHVVRDAAGAINLASLLPAEETTKSAPPQAGQPIALILQQAALSGGIVDLEDRGQPQPFKARLGPVNIGLADFSTRPDESGAQRIALTLESGARIDIAATTTMTPLRSQGTMTVKGPALDIVYRYLRDRLAFELAGGEQAVSARFSLVGEPGRGVEAKISDLTVAVTDAHLRDPATHGDFLALPALHLTGGTLSWPQRTASAGELQLQGLRVAVRRERDGALDIARLLASRTATEPGTEPVPAAGGATPPAETTPGAPTEPWHVTLGRFTVQDAGLRFRDETRNTPAELAIEGLDLSLTGLSSEPNAHFGLDSRLAFAGGGTVAVQGSIAAIPDVLADASLAIDGLKLAQFQPWVSDFARVQIHDGSLQFKGQVKATPAESFALQGDADIKGLDTQDVRKDERLLAWSELAVDDLRFAATARSLKISRVRLVQPYARVFIAKDQTTNIGDVLVQEPKPAAGSGAEAPGRGGRTTPAPAAKPFAVRVGKLIVTSGAADYTDLSLPLPFAAHIEALGGTITAIDTRSEEPSRIKLEGQVGRYGLTRIEGLLRAGAPTELADINLVFRNVEMATLSPYTVKFAGHKIAGGTLDLDLRYKLDHRKMVGENKVVIDKLELGEKFPSPDAINLPLGLAIALLKDADGRIDIDMPVTGSLDDPQFRIGPVIWKAFTTLLTRIVTSPFRLLGRLIGVESEDLGEIAFAPGRTDLLPPEREKLERIAEVLGKRPQLTVSIPATVATAPDTAALKAARLEEAVERELQAGATGRGGSVRDLDARTRRVLEDFYEAAFPSQLLKDLRARFTVPLHDDPQAKPRFDEGAYVAELRRQLVVTQAVAPADLDALGVGRANSVRAALLAAGVAEARVSTAARKDVTAKDGGVPLALVLGGI